MGRAWLANWAALWAEARGTLLGQDQKGGEEELGLRPEQRGEFSSFLFFSFLFFSFLCFAFLFFLFLSAF